MGRAREGLRGESVADGKRDNEVRLKTAMLPAKSRETTTSAHGYVSMGEAQATKLSDLQADTQLSVSPF